MTRINEEDYAYATARIRAVETRLLDQQSLDRMLDAGSPEDAMKVLTDAQYGLAGSEPAGVSSYESLLVEEMDKCQRLLAEVMPNPEVLDLFRMRIDSLNAKIILKAVFQDKPLPDGLAEGGLIPPHRLGRMIQDRTWSGMDDALRAAILESTDVFSRNPDPQGIDLVLDKALFAQMVREAGEWGNDWLSELVAYTIDAANIRVFFRGRLIGKGLEFFRRALATGGTIRSGLWSDMADRPIEAFIEALRYTWFGDAATRGFEGWKSGKGISWLEKQLDDRLMGHIRKARFTAMGVEPMVGYLFAKETEIRNVRIILTGKINRIPQETVRERLRLGYA